MEDLEDFQLPRHGRDGGPPRRGTGSREYLGSGETGRLSGTNERGVGLGPRYTCPVHYVYTETFSVASDRFSTGT